MQTMLNLVHILRPMKSRIRQMNTAPFGSDALIVLLQFFCGFVLVRLKSATRSCRGPGNAHFISIREVSSDAARRKDIYLLKTLLLDYCTKTPTDFHPGFPVTIFFSSYIITQLRSVSCVFTIKIGLDWICTRQTLSNPAE